ncbi:Fanconi anemia group D2 protein [Choanephora cucurbitarum]|uniref:Fanconi anemia group D2 protein n=1 Tax=Choanephora cucurbitarum TaxID=101091 RepID=A0A1C7N957_9FUNG|nr:Fanconi anemia group D2 protein [Choanephora cucurbitarum]
MYSPIDFTSIIQITPTVIQCEIITSLPDIVNDSEHKPIVVYLKELMNDSSELTVPILDALSNLTLHSESLDDVRETVLERLESAEIDDLATIVKFLLQTVTPTTIDMVVYGIRQKLDFRSLGKLQQQQAKHAEALILESIKLGLQFHKFVCDAWLRSVVALESQMDYQSNYWSTILSLSESILRSSQQNQLLSPCASTLYTASFKAADVYYRQEIIGALVTHIGSGIEAEMNVALNVLLKLVKHNVSQVAVYSVFVKGILDYLDNLNVYQIRTLFDIFSLLALTTGNASDGSANLWSDIQIVIRKQLSNPREKYKNIGIIASLCSVKVLGSRQLCEDYQPEQSAGSSTQTTGKSYTNAMRHPLLRQATNLLELALRYSKEYPHCIALVYDELAHMFAEEDMDERFIAWVKENMASDFTEFYVVATADAVEYINQSVISQYTKLMPELQMGLDGENDQIAVKFYEVIYSPEIKKKKSMIVPMCSIFNLIQSCEQQLNQGSLVEIDALFGCSIVLFKIDDEHELNTEELEYACDMLFYTINWFRELLNAFMFTKEEENFRTRLITRLRNIIEMEQLMSQLMQQLPNYVPLEFQQTHSVAIEETALQIARFSKDSPEPTNKAVKKATKSSHIKFGSIVDLRAYMRAFEIHLLEMLKYNEEIEEEDERMTYEEINYILDDMNQKLNIKIGSPSTSTAGKKKAISDESKYPTCNSVMLARMDTRKLMQKMIGYLPNLLQVLEKLYADIQSKDIDPGRVQGSEELVLAVSHIFNILYKLFHWSDIQNSDNQDILHSAIIAIVNRNTSGKQKGKSVASTNGFEQAFHYLSQFGNNMPQAKTAVLLFKILQRLMTLSEQSSDQVKRDALGVVKQIISTSWFDWRDIRKEIQFLFEQYIELSKNSLEVLHDIVNDELPKFEEERGLKEYPLLREDTIVDHYQAIINQIVKSFDLLKETDQDVEVTLLQTAQIVKSFERVTNYVKTREQKLLIGILLRTSRTYIEQFTKHSIPFFTKIFKQHKNSILAIFKDFQTSTRMLQIICSHVKVLKEVQLAAYVPTLKKVLEIVIYQVKMLLTENHIPPSAFFMGALKHRDMRGAEVSSQIPHEPSDEEMEEDVNDQEEENILNDDTPARKVYKPTRRRRKNASPLTPQDYRTSSVVPSSEEEEEEEADEQLPDDEEEEEEEEDRLPDEEGSGEEDSPGRGGISIKRKRREEGDEDEIIIRFDNNQSNEDEEEEEEDTSATKLTKQQTKRKRLGVGRYNKPSNKR